MLQLAVKICHANIIHNVGLKTITLYIIMFLVCTACNVSFLCNKEMYKQKMKVKGISV